MSIEQAICFSLFAAGLNFVSRLAELSAHHITTPRKAFVFISDSSNHAGLGSGGVGENQFHKRIFPPWGRAANYG
jgi:hypothetical protein